MRLQKYKFVPPVKDQARVAPRLADASDPFVASPVHEMVRDLWDQAQPPRIVEDDRYPGWARLTIPVAASATLWALIITAWRMLA